MTLEILAFVFLMTAVGAYSAYDHKRMQKHAEKNAEKIAELARREIALSGMSVEDFPDQLDGLRGERPLKIPEVIAIYGTCRKHRERSRHDI